MEEIQETTPVETPEAGPEPEEGSDRLRMIGLVLIATVLVIVISLAFYGLAAHPQATAVLRDISIIVLALVTGVIGLFLVVLIFQLQSLMALLRDEIKPILDSANETASTVRGTTTFVSDAVVTPMINLVSLASGIGQTLRTLATTGRKGKGQRTPPPAPKQE
jgi:hypothetical protein